MKSLVIIGIVLTPFHLLAQFDLSKVKPFTMNQRVQIVSPTGQVISESMMKTDVRTDAAAQKLYHIRTTSDGRKDSTVCDLKTLLPTYFSSIGNGIKQWITYSKNDLKAYSERNGTVTLREQTFPIAQTIYDTYMDTYLVELMPLQEGYTSKFYIFRLDLGKETAFEVKQVSPTFYNHSDGKITLAYLVVCKNENVTLIGWYDRQSQHLLKMVITLPNGGAFIRETITTNDNESNDYKVINRTITPLEENGKQGIRFSAAAGEGIAWINGKTFGEGTIKLDVRGEDVFQKSFVGIAFHGENEETYETVYFRPFNFKSDDPIRRIHAVQYAFAPKFGFQELRNTRKDEFESAILPVPNPTDWFHAKIEVRKGRIKVFVNDFEKPCLDVPTLNPSGKAGKIGFWVGNNSAGDFANLKTAEK